MISSRNISKQIGFFILCNSLILMPTLVLSEEDAQQKFQGFNLQGYTDDGDKAWDVNGDTADIDGTAITLSNVDANTYGEGQTNVKAQTGVIDQTKGTLQLKDDVVITNEDGSKLKTDSLDWDRNQDIVQTDDRVIITDEKITVTGKGMKAKPSLRTAHIQEEVEVKVNQHTDQSEDKVITIVSDGSMELDLQTGTAIFVENVIAVQGDQTLKADRMEVKFDQSINQINEIVCIGNVSIIKGENQTFADKATYLAKDQKVVLSGRPKLIMVTEGENAFTPFGN